jgi:hypothetical protein
MAIEIRIADCKDPSPNRVQAPALDAVTDRVPRESELEQLAPGHNPVLPPSKSPDTGRLTRLAAHSRSKASIVRIRPLPSRVSAQIDAGGGSRTHTPLRAMDFESIESAVPPLRLCDRQR